MEKRCSKCRKFLSVDTFRFRPNGRTKRPWCKPCEHRWFRERRKSDPFLKLSENLRLRYGYKGAAKDVREKLGLPSVCYLCGKKIKQWKDAELDHVKPRSRGGPTTIRNLKWAHAVCNRVKRDLLIPEMLSLFRRIIKHLG